MYDFFKDFGLILLVCKACGIISKKIGAPQVVGEIIGGLILGPSCLNLMQSGDTISLFAEIGVLLMMFSTGLTTDLKKLVKTGPVAFAMACVGVFIPLIGGYLLYSCFYGFAAVGTTEFYSAVFIGTIMTATSVSITVATLQELGKISTTLGTTIVSAAIIDDVIGIIVLTCVTGAAGGGESGGFLSVLLRTLLFFVFAIIVSIALNKVMALLDERYPHTQRIPIFSLACCFLMAWAAETFFGIADITGAYICGVALCTVEDSDYIERKMEISGYMIFSPIFFANIGLQTEFSGMTSELIIFSVLFVIVAMVAKIVGCGTIAKLAGYNLNDSLKAGVGMMTRGEVALIVAEKGLSIGLIDASYFSCVILLIIVSSITTPAVLKALYARDKVEEQVA